MASTVKFGFLIQYRGWIAALRKEKGIGQGTLNRVMKLSLFNTAQNYMEKGWFLRHFEASAPARYRYKRRSIKYNEMKRLRDKRMDNITGQFKTIVKPQPRPFILFGDLYGFHISKSPTSYKIKATATNVGKKTISARAVVPIQTIHPMPAERVRELVRISAQEEKDSSAFLRKDFLKNLSKIQDFHVVNIQKPASAA